MRQVPANNEFEAIGGSNCAAGTEAHAPITQNRVDFEIVFNFLRRLLRTDFNFSPAFIIQMFHESSNDIGHFRDGKLALPPEIRAQITELLSPYIEMSIASLGFTIDHGERRIRSKRTLELLDLLETLCPGATASYEDEKLTLREWAQPRKILPRTRSGIRELLSKLLPL